VSTTSPKRSIAFRRSQQTDSKLRRDRQITASFTTGNLGIVSVIQSHDDCCLWLKGGAPAP